MSEDRRQRAEELPGDPAGWLATLRELLRAVQRTDPSRAELRDRLADDPGGETAGRRLDFLEAVGVLDCEDDGCSPGRYGREFLDTHDEEVLFEGLTSGVAGFETLLESLAVRPLTDVEFMDLLSVEFGVEMDSPDPAIPHRNWLLALGYVDHDDGINELTRAGRRLVKTDDELTPPTAGGGAGAPAESGSEAAEATRQASPRGADPAPSDTVSDTGGVESRTAELRSGDAPVEPPESPEPSSDAPAFADELRRRYDDTCMVCGDRRRRSPGEGFSEVHHPMPPSAPHEGPAAPENAVVVCPNHRADFEHGLLRVDPRTLEIDHAYDAEVSGRTLSTAEGHRVGGQYLAYHNDVVAEF